MLPRHDLSALKIFNMTLVRIKDRYVDPGASIRKMLYAALDGVQLNIPNPRRARRRAQTASASP